MAGRHPYVPTLPSAAHPPLLLRARSPTKTPTQPHPKTPARTSADWTISWLETTPTPAPETTGSSIPTISPGPAAPVTNTASSSSSTTSTAVDDSDTASRFSQCSTLVDSAAAQDQAGPDVTVNFAVTYIISANRAASIMRPCYGIK